MTVADYINHPESDQRRFSFEVLPPLKGNGTEALFATIDKLAELNPAFINITTHHSEYVYRELDNGQFERQRIRRRPGTIAIAAAIQNRYHIPVEPHIICSGTTIEQTEYELLDLQFLGIRNLMLLRGDKAKEDARFTPTNVRWSGSTRDSLPMVPLSSIPVRSSTSAWPAIPRNTKKRPIWSATWSI